MRLSKPATALVVATALLTTAEAQKPTVIEGQVVDATADEAPPRHPVAVWYEESGIDHEPAPRQQERTASSGSISPTTWASSACSTCARSGTTRQY